MPPLSRDYARSPFYLCFALLTALGLVAATPARADDHGGRWFQVVSPGRSIQRAIDRARPGGWVLVLPGVYHETADATNGLNITKGINLVGLSTPRKRVVLENAGGQRNGIVAVPAAHTSGQPLTTRTEPSPSIRISFSAPPSRSRTRRGAPEGLALVEDGEPGEAGLDEPRRPARASGALARRRC